MVITCRNCNLFSVTVTEDELERLKTEYIQDVFYHMTADQRELLITGWCGKCFDELLAEEEF